VVEEDRLVLMPRRPSTLARWLPERACPWLSLVLIAAAACLHLAYLAWDCPLDLAPDEAHYWDWSRHLDWSYYSKGPLVAWLIRGSCELFGAWSEQHTGSLTFAIRLPAVACGSLLLVSLYLLTVGVFGRPRLGLAVVAAALTVPLITAGSTLMTIDSPYTCCWGWALVFAHRAVFSRSAPSGGPGSASESSSEPAGPERASWAWEAAGLAVGLGVLAKYNMAAFIPSLALFLLTSREHRRLLLSAGFWSMVGVSLLAGLPILLWNAQHDWVTVRHVARLAGFGGGEAPVRSGEAIHCWGPAGYVGMQAGMLLGYWFLAWALAMLARNPLRERDAGVCYLWWLSSPMFLFFLAFSLKTGGGEPNWPVAAYLSGGVLVAGWLLDKLEARSRALRRLTRVAVLSTCLVGLGVTAAAHHSERIHPLLAFLAGPATPDRPYPVRRFDPTCRLRGWRTLAKEIDRMRGELSSQGEAPVLAADSWSVPGELGVYCEGHPQAYSVGLVQGDRHSQYDYWTNPLDHPEGFRGRTFLVVGGIRESLRQGFDHIDEPSWVTHCVNGRPVACWAVYVCRGFHGFPEKPKGSH
jgi:4-amino-4-deoxy-L-arabinose transferase-like glycosyltransferase